MTLRSYGVLAGRVVGSRAEGGSDTPHFQIHVRAGGVDYRVAVNVLSSESPSELLYVADERFAHPLLDELAGVPDGFTTVPSARGGLALDFVRGNLLDRTLMRPVPASSPGPDNDLADLIGHYTARAMADPDARVFAFGERWGPESQQPDKVFGFSPGNGVHDIHMNQGNSGRFVRDDGVWQDGALLFGFPQEHSRQDRQWVAVFLAFQSQSWHTDDTTGHALPGEPGPVPGPEDPHGVVTGRRRAGQRSRPGAGAGDGDTAQQALLRSLGERSSPSRQAADPRLGRLSQRAAWGIPRHLPHP